MSGSGGGGEPASAAGAVDDYSTVKRWLEDQGKSLELMDEGGVNIHKVEGAVDDIGKVDDVLEGGEVLERGSGALEGSRNGIFSNVDESALKDTVREHVFSQKHIKSGIMDLGTSQDEIMNKGINILKELDSKGLLKDGPTQIKTYIDGMQTEIKVFIKEGQVINFDMFKGWSARDMGNTIFH